MRANRTSIDPAHYGENARVSDLWSIADSLVVYAVAYTGAV